ncbi:hypothetical protein [Streptomyces sp. JB150]|uniref:hypothetical protein n=1 Tax=Streptomyces sp. JB150 TaxID=2714844 RepID=UPI00140B1499|nr:hypothetical protein [Streptomyces sp. JB150]QIJ63286.1 hypothetical protein G7Z13_15560 [Streptomyces sp. JB150]
MTQSGQGEEPSAQRAHEGIVLPSDGGEPVLPGAQGGPGRPADGPLPAQAPPGAQSWGEPWGPGPQQHAATPQQQNWPAPPDQAWGDPQGGHPAPRPGDGAPPAQQAPSAPGAGPLPPEGASGPSYGGDAGAPGAAYGPHAGAPAQAYGPGPYAQAPGAAYGGHAGGYDGSGRPVQGGAAGAYPGTPGGGPLPPAADEGATQYIPPVGAAPGPDGATQYLPPVRPAADEGATQYLPPVTPGALPPEMPAAGSAERPDESTRYLGRVPSGETPGGQPPAGPDAQATQYIPPVAGGRQTPAEFDSLFRADGPAEGTRHLPHVQDPPRPPAPAYDEPAPGRGRGGRTGSRVPLIAACGVAIAVVGIGAGALLADNGGEEESPRPVSATAPASQSASASPSPSADPAEQQAVALDKLLADSGDSRTAVINAVNDVKSCTNLTQAAKDLRDAAEQRNELVTRLSGLAVDKLPDHAALTTALTNAWKASASADNHYAGWADQVAARKGKLCKKGQARSTPQTEAGNRESGTATTQKAQAAKLWNAIARTYGLTERQPTQL